jgi:hypothetical protein
MRYIIHLLPAEGQRRAYDDLRARIAAVIGPNRALDYPGAHVTLVWAIQDGPDDPAPIDPAALIAALEAECGSGSLSLATREDVHTREHILFPLIDTPALAALRHRLYLAARTIAAGPDGTRTDRAERVREQTWPHLTFAQEIDEARWERGMAILAEARPQLREPVQGTELALVARDIAAGTPYRIVWRGSLVG